jgi:glycosyltransferase involved in cell wall biosynthesis
LLYKNEDLRKSLSSNARLFAEKYLDWDKIAKKTFEIYKEIID